MEWWGRVGSRLRAMHAVDLTGPKIQDADAPGSKEVPMLLLLLITATIMACFDIFWWLKR
ncbi:MAG: hypothetical protein KDA27_13430 [Candidatus Eisenbacteria bacterium]|uniref:Uncharacterized protein n=1 Tax=Eiseniibacteriota bacterium TaxID=2212470 RepID=A0A956SEY6_UNCEI|nr:hypothetical protein [Candidatus Eisenbacteria bacterium]